MVEGQPTAQCPHCGYPIEIGEHAPECPNNASNLNESKNGESDAKKLDPEVDQNELREYTREDKSEERQVVADAIREQRGKYFQRQKSRLANSYE